jgi:hypothetical protein
MEKTIMEVPEAQVSVGWKEIHAVVERSPCIGIQMRLPCLEQLLAWIFHPL